MALAQLSRCSVKPTHVVGRPGLRLAAPRPVRLQVRAQQKAPAPRAEKDVYSQVKTQCESFFRRYDFVSTGMGALAVTSYCVARGQDPFTALSITATSVIAALVINELWTSGDSWTV